MDHGGLLEGGGGKKRVGANTRKFDIPYRLKVRRPKFSPVLYFVGRNFRHLVKISSLRQNFVTFGRRIFSADDFLLPIISFLIHAFSFITSGRGENTQKVLE